MKSPWDGIFACLPNVFAVSAVKVHLLNSYKYSFIILCLSKIVYIQQHISPNFSIIFKFIFNIYLV